MSSRTDLEEALDIDELHNSVDLFGETEIPKDLEKIEVGDLKLYLISAVSKIHNTPVKAAVCGSGGQGKSTIINTLRGLQYFFDEPVDEKKDSKTLPAPTGEVETTTAVHEYLHPEYPNFTLYDLPGVGTPKFPRATYVSTTQLIQYDFFLIISSTRFTEEDIWLANTLAELKKPFFFVRSKIDEAIRNDAKRKIPEQICLRTIRMYTTNNILELPGATTIDIRLFLISGELEYADCWDFPDLKKAVVDVLPEVKRNCVTLYVSGLTTEWINAKKKVLQKRIKYYAGLSALCALIPIPGTSILADIVLLVKFSMECNQAFGLREKDVPLTYRRTDTVQQLLTRALQYVSSAYIIHLFSVYAAETVVEEFVRYIPVVGLAVASTLSFGVNYKVMKKILEDQHNMALELSSILIKLGHSRSFDPGLKEL